MTARVIAANYGQEDPGNKARHYAAARCSLCGYWQDLSYDRFDKTFFCKHGCYDSAALAQLGVKR